MKRALLLQLPVPDFRWPHLQANLPLAAGYLAAWARSRVPGWRVELLPWHAADRLGDEALLEAVLAHRPDLVGFSVYLWNAERSVFLARALAAEGVRVVLGGPEVQTDNPWLVQDTEGLVRIEGEGEEAFASVLQARDPPGWIPAGPPVDLGSLASPYLAGLLPPAPDGSVWLETVRGCPFRCAYCHYGKLRRGVRRFPDPWLAEHLDWAARVGAREIYLMDPSFNVRARWEETLAALARGNRRGLLRYHTELVADRLPPGHAGRLAEAGLVGCEVGLQSIHPRVLARVGRTWHRDRWLRGVHELLRAGVSVTVGLIAGLPEDTLEGFASTVEFVLSEIPQAELQLFPLALLPGTPLRAQAAELGLEAAQRPPYAVGRTPWWPPEEMMDAFRYFEQRTGLELDPAPLPRLAGPWDGAGGGPYLSGVRIHAGRAPADWPALVARRSARNLLLWVRGWDEALPGQLRRLLARCPHLVCSVLLDDGAGWPPERLAALLASGTGRHYLDRHLRPLYGPGSRLIPRLLVLVGEGDPAVRPEWLAAVRTRAEVLWAVEAAGDWPRVAAARAGDGESVYVTATPRREALAQLATRLGPDAAGVVFSDPGAQRYWDEQLGADGAVAPDFRMTLP
ncbi:MAG: hypothetical protein Kow0092_17390 [Deferrisomatales bacterium]